MLSIQDLDIKGKTVFLRCDINSPIDPTTLKILDDSRLLEVAETIDALKDSKLIVASHQGRLGKSDYVSMEQHAPALSNLLNRKINFIPDVFGPTAINSIKNLNDGDILLLDNLRFTAEENAEMLPKDARKSHLVSKLAEHIDYCVLDAFSTSHRSHPSIVGKL